MRGATALTCALVSFTQASHAEPSKDEIARFEKAYPLGRIYITFDVLSAVKTCLENPIQFHRLESQHPDSARMLRSFLESNVQPRMGDSAAFLELDFKTQHAYFKMTSGRDGQVSELEWGSQIWDLATLIDAMIEHEIRTETAIRKIEGGRLTVLDASYAFEQVRGDEHVSPSSKAQLAQAFLRLYGRAPTPQINELDGDLKQQVAALVTKDAFAKISEVSTPAPSSKAVAKFEALIPNRDPDVDSGRGRDRVVVNVARDSSQELKRNGKYRLVFVSRDPSQERLIKVIDDPELTLFHNDETSRESAIAPGSALSFSLFYTSVFGKFQMQNPSKQWAIKNVGPGDIVTVSWGE